MGASPAYMPAGPVQDPSRWRAEDFARDRDWVYELTDEDRAELEQAAQGLKDEGLAPPAYGREQFAIPRLAARKDTA